MSQTLDKYVLQEGLVANWIGEELQTMLGYWDKDELRKQSEFDRKSRIEKQVFDIETFSYDCSKPFAELKQTMEPLPGYDGLIFFNTIRSNPDGKKVCDSVIHCDIVAYLDQDSQTIDNTLAAVDANVMDLAEVNIVEGLRIILNTMREGEVASFIINDELAYGKLGAYPDIPPESEFLYKIRINRVWGETDLIPLLNKERLESVFVDEEQLFKSLVSYKDCANELLRDGYYKFALQRYKVVLKNLQETSEKELMQSSRDNPKYCLMITVLQNLAVSYLKLKKFKKVSRCAKDIYTLEPNNMKALYLLSKAKLELGKPSQALNYLQIADRLSPNNRAFDDIRWELHITMRDERQEVLDLQKTMAKACI